MRFIRIFQLYFQVVLYYRAESLVYFLMAFVNPIASFMFWRGAYGQSLLSSAGWSYSEILSYYLLLIIASAMLMAHIEWDVAYEDIQQGYLVNHLMKPLFYTVAKLYTEIPWRITQGFFGILFFLFYIFVLKGEFTLVSNGFGIISAVVIAVLAFLLSFFIKMIVGFLAFWTTDFSGIQQTLEVTIIVLSGFVLPLVLYPEPIRAVVLHQPFAYVIYYPLLAFIGNLTHSDIISVISFQLFWLVILVSITHILWKLGLRRFTGVGN